MVMEGGLNLVSQSLGPRLECGYFFGALSHALARLFFGIGDIGWREVGAFSHGSLPK
jgi:hypothetical protein